MHIQSDVNGNRETVKAGEKRNKLKTEKNDFGRRGQTKKEVTNQDEKSDQTGWAVDKSKKKKKKAKIQIASKTQSKEKKTLAFWLHSPNTIRNC